MRNFQELKKLKGVIAHQGGLGVKANSLYPFHRGIGLTS